eukprot:3747944-Prymnesium_polylepis.1
MQKRRACGRARRHVRKHEREREREEAKFARRRSAMLSVSASARRKFIMPLARPPSCCYERTDGEAAFNLFVERLHALVVVG